MADFADKLVTLDNLATYTEQLKTNIDNPTIVHKNATAAADGTYPVYVFDGVNLKSLGLNWTKTGETYQFSHTDINGKIQFVAFSGIQINNLEVTSYLRASNVYFTNTANISSIYITSKTSIVNKEYVDTQIETLQTTIAALEERIKKLEGN